MRIHTIILLLLAIALGAGCDRYLSERDPVGPAPTLLTVPTDVRALVSDGAVRLTWTMSSTAGIELYRIYQADDSAGAFQLIDSATTTEATLTDLPLNQQYYFTVAAVSADGIESVHSDLVAAFFSRLSVIINEGDAYTNQRTVTVHIHAPDGAAFMRFGEQADLSESSWMTFEASQTFELSASDEVKTVYAEVLFEDGSRTDGTISDEIILDTWAAISSVAYTPEEESFGPSDVVTFTLESGETGGEAWVELGGIEVVPLCDNGLSGDAVSGDGVYSAQWTVPYGLSLENANVSGWFIDAARNEAQVRQAATGLTVASPLPAPVLTALPLSTYEVALSWSPTTASGFVAYRVYRGASGDVDSDDLLLATLTDAAEAGWTDTTASAGTTSYYRVYAINRFGQYSGSNAAEAMTPQNTSPSPVVLNGVLSQAGIVSLSWTESEEYDFASYRLFSSETIAVSDASEALVTVEDRQETAVDHYLETGATRYYRVYVIDRHGAQCTGSNIVSVTAP